MMRFIKNLFSRKAELNKSADLGWRTLWGGFQNGVDFGGGLEVSEAKALGISAVFLAIRTISEDIGMLSRKVCEVLPGDSGVEWQEKNPVDWLVNHEVNQEMTPMSFWETLVSHALGWGNGYAEIVWNGSGSPSSMHIIFPDITQPMIAGDGSVLYRVSGRKGGGFTYLRAEDVFHLHGIGFDGLLGYSPIRTMSETMGVTLGADKTARRFFSNGLKPSGHFTHPGELSPQALANLKNQIAEQSGVGGSNQTLILEEGMDWKPITISPVDAQLLLSRQYSVIEVARMFRIPPSKLMSLEKAAYNTLEQQDLDYAKCLRPWCVRIAQEVKRKLFPASKPNLCLIHDMRPIEMADAKSRSQFYREMTGIGAITPNQVRRYEGWNPLPDDQGGDETYMQNNMVPLRRITEDPPEQPAPAEPAPAPDPTPEASPDGGTALGDGDGGDHSMASAFRGLFVAGIKRYRRLEADKYKRGKIDPAVLLAALNGALGPTIKAYQDLAEIKADPPDLSFLIMSPLSVDAAADELAARIG